MVESFWLCVLYHISMGIIFWEKKAIRYHWSISDLEEYGSLWVTWLEKYWSKVIWHRTPPIAYPKVSVSIQIYYSGSKCLRIEVSVKAFRRCMKAFLASRIRKSVLKLTFIKLAFDKSDILDLVNFNFLDLAEFVIGNKVLILPSTSPPLVLPTPPSVSWFFLFSIA